LIEILLFDLGGVVIDIDFERSFRKWSTHSGVPVETIRSGFSHDQVYEQHERGEIGSIEFYHYVSEHIEMELSFEQFKEGWNEILVAPFPQTIGLLRKLANRIPLYMLSNSNPMHKEYWEKNFADELEPFNQIFVSSDLGYRKPEADAYLHVVEALNISPEEIVFFDDLADNVEAARVLGMQTVQVRSSADISSYVASAGLI
jgi:epoxide hydrolase-like predicted phosphatase